MLDSKLLKKGLDVSVNIEHSAYHKVVFNNDILKPYSTQFVMVFQFENSERYI